MAVSTFISFSPSDSTSREQLETHLAVLVQQGILELWHRDCVGPGEAWESRVDAHLESAQLVLLLVSARYLATEHYCHEMNRALARHEGGETRAIPIIISQCSWMDSPLGKLRSLPSSGIPVRNWPDTDQAWHNVTQGIQVAIKQLETQDRRIPHTYSGPRAAHQAADRTMPRASLKGEPKYQNEQTRLLSLQLEEAHARKRILQELGASIEQINDEIMDLKRKLREGGQLRTGDFLGGGRYLLIEQIGRGGFASVWKAHDLNNNEIVAIKILHPNLAGDPLRVDRFFRGARIMADIDHPAVARVLDPHGEDGGWQYFVMEYLSGGDLRRAIIEKKIPRENVVPLILRVGEALSFAHSRGIVHRDVKPANILLDSNNSPKLTDFDLVSAGDTTGGTRTGALGTLLYAAPECMHEPQKADARADVYGVGMTAIFCINAAELSLAVIRNIEETIDSLPCSDRVRSVLKHATAWSPEQRISNAAQFCEDLRESVDAMAMPAADLGFGRDILYWVADDRGIGETIWLTDDGDDVRVVARVSRLIFGAASQVWTWAYRPRSVRLLDQEAFGRALEQGKMIPDVFDDLPIVQEQILDAELASLVTGQRLSFGIFDDDYGSSDDGRPSWLEFEQSIYPMYSVGPYLLVRRNISTYSGGAHGHRAVEFWVIDLRTGEIVDLLSRDERARVTNREGKDAAQRLHGQEHSFLERDQLPEITMFSLAYDHDDRLNITYQFTGPSSYVASDGRWHDYTISVPIHGKDLPSSLEEFRVAPPALRRYWSKAPRLAGKTGWTAVQRSADTLRILRRLFSPESRG